ncbi:MAG TPA: cation diffusion facilitator family transporter [Candidatus Binataceae bacterium]|nr:cation diffusion facilitator family transporter [Candidatus Binataceae bacterium]
MASEHAHDISPQSLPAFGWAAGLHAAYVAVEAGFGFATGSLALLADAAHNLTDVAGLMIAWGAAILAMRQPTRRHTYGLGQATMMAALVNAIALLIGVGAIGWEAIHRFHEVVDVPAGTLLWVALIGIAVNAGTAILFVRTQHRDLNARAAFLHLASDAAVSVGVVLAAGAILLTGWMIIDPIVALLIGAVVAWSSFGLFKSALHMSLSGVPDKIDIANVEEWLRARPGVTAVHDLHVWPLSTTSTALTAHLIMPGGHPGDAALDHLAHELGERFAIAHATFQIEIGDGPECHLAPAGVV